MNLFRSIQLPVNIFGGFNLISMVFPIEVVILVSILGVQDSVEILVSGSVSELYKKYEDSLQ